MTCTQFIVGTIVFSVVFAATVGFSILAGDWTSIREELVSDVVIESNHGIVWDVLTKFDQYDEWNSVISNVTGLLVSGEKLRITLTDFPFVAVPIEVNCLLRFC